MFSRLLFLLSALVSCHALYFHIAETEKKCFIEEIPDETMVRLFCALISYVYRVRCTCVHIKMFAGLLHLAYWYDICSLNFIYVSVSTTQLFPKTSLIN